MSLGSHTVRPRASTRGRVAGLLLVTTIAGACAGGTVLPPPRPLIVSSGARLTADPARLQEIYDWVIPLDEFIAAEPSFIIESIPSEDDPYPWESLVVVQNPVQDTARYQVTRINPDVQTPYNIYAFFHLWDRKGRLEEWLPGGDSLEGYALEREIVGRIADAWLLGRASFDTQPHEGMDELIYVKDAGFLDAFIFMARPEAFPDARADWLMENPGRLEEYRTWFRETLGGEPPAPSPDPRRD